MNLINSLTLEDRNTTWAQLSNYNSPFLDPDLHLYSWPPRFSSEYQWDHLHKTSHLHHRPRWSNLHHSRERTLRHPLDLCLHRLHPEPRLKEEPSLKKKKKRENLNLESLQLWEIRQSVQPICVCWGKKREVWEAGERWWDGEKRERDRRGWDAKTEWLIVDDGIQDWLTDLE